LSYINLLNINRMKIPFKKYHGTGNDFIMIDQRTTRYLELQDVDKIKHLCDRRFGIGGDGLILLENDTQMDFRMVYFNADGRQSTMCGNGGRCIVKFAHDLDIVNQTCDFLAIDGPHAAMIDPLGLIHLKMKDVDMPLKHTDIDYQLDTGSPHYVQIVDQLPTDVKSEGAAIRYNPMFSQDGINVNFVKRHDHYIEVATYERGVEDQTYSCGTGVVASAITMGIMDQTAEAARDIRVSTKGGDLRVKYKIIDSNVIDVWLIGPAVHVFDGEYEISKH
jgi:diaminopimelate epimerase